MRRICWGLLFVAVACSTRCLCADEPTANAALTKIADDYLKFRFDANPLEAVLLGKHEYDGKFSVPVRATLLDNIDRLKAFDAATAKIDPQSLSPALRSDWRLLRYTLATQLWELETQRDPWRNPMYYAKALDLTVYLKRDFKPLAERVRDITAILRQAPALYAAARENLEPTLPKVLVETAISMAEGTATFLKTDVAKEAAKVEEKNTRDVFEAASAVALDAVNGYVAWLKKERLPKGDGSFALGRNGYIRMLRAEMVDLTPEQVLGIGLAELRVEQGRMAKAAAEIDPTAKPMEVYQAIQREHPTAAGLIPDTRKNLELIRQFVVDRKIVTIPSDVRAMVAETPPPLRATSFASMDTPGPWEKKATAAYYYVTPVNPSWSAMQQDEWLMAFNYYTTDIVSIHEAYPGHYQQFLALNASKASTLAKVLNSYAFVEGWAHYTEQMMIEEGFAQAPATASRADRVRGAKYRVAQSGEALLRLCRLCCSVKLHTQGISADEATQFFMENCYYAKTPAKQEATRGTYDPGYLYYSLGKLMIYKLRRDWQAQEGKGFTLQRFHDEFLSHGAPPIRMLRESMLKDEEIWGATLSGSR